MGTETSPSHIFDLTGKDSDRILLGGRLRFYYDGAGYVKECKEGIGKCVTFGSVCAGLRAGSRGAGGAQAFTWV